MTISTSIIIKATPSTIWSILMDFENYAQWNPFIQSIQGDTKIGGQLYVKIGSMQFKPIVQTNQVHVHFSWLGKLWMKGLFDGCHQFELKQLDEYHCEFIHSETFTGIAVPLFKNKLNTEIRQGFQQLNNALKIKAESLISN